MKTVSIFRAINRDDRIVIIDNMYNKQLIELKHNGTLSIYSDNISINFHGLDISMEEFKKILLERHRLGEVTGRLKSELNKFYKNISKYEKEFKLNLRSC